ncbi:MAG: UDP-N-acetylglucosamine--N-acetylmuramyl-(pentapeptide) pyrophosphoryl-undecaprenol N-acetylglucosamine transferase, partial [Candidatus Peregrinibacteria bacterium]|nr:UDP-N-acetylglucosamine--N-acetylmuramyl-(pentapeptide) pyrophosphoryl-undecaprenol N-acetylglucosamine transferase [Candidatus Peregrinibacteria bacterium]
MRILLSGGGTAGHVLPHTAVVKQLEKQDPSLEVLYVGSQNGPERKIVHDWGWHYTSIPVGKWRRYWDWRNLVDPFKVLFGILKSEWIIVQFRPDVIFSKGGFVSVPLILAGWLLRIPIVIHDSDAMPGLTTRIAARFAKTICLGYEEAKARLPKSSHKKVVVSGTPVREEMLRGNVERGRKLAGFKGGKPVVLVMGGSLGAKTVNEAIWEVLPGLLKVAQVIHLTGRGKALETAENGINKTSKGDLKGSSRGGLKNYLSRDLEGAKGYKMLEYVGKELADLYAMADLVVSRAGGNSLVELQALQKPMVLVPLGSPVSHGDQEANAIILEARGAALVIRNEDLTGEKLLET